MMGLIKIAIKLKSVVQIKLNVFKSFMIVIDSVHTLVQTTKFTKKSRKMVNYKSSKEVMK